MGDHNEHLFSRLQQHRAFSAIIDGQDAAVKALRAEKVAAEKQAALASAYRQMPSDMRQRAKEWGVESLMELVWLNGWDCGYRQSIRDSAAVKDANHDKS